MIKLKCPNCLEDMQLETKNVIYDNYKYDKWICGFCSHIIVLDWRGD